MPRDSAKSRYRLLLGLLFTTLLGVHAAVYWPFLCDDSLITLRYARRLLEGQGLTWTDGEPVEGYSNLLWLLATAGVGALGIDLVVAARLLGFAGMLAVPFTAVAWFTRRHSRQEIFWPLLVGMGFFVLSAPVAIWTLGGLEQPLLASLLALSIPLTWKRLEGREVGGPWLLGGVLAGICLTRPDGPLFTVATAATFALGAWLTRSSSMRRDAWRVAILPTLAYAGHVVFRLAYYGEVIPNTARIKLAPTVHYLTTGLEYLTTGLGSALPFTLLAVAALFALVKRPESRLRGLHLVLLIAAWLPYAAAVGGDIFPGHRHLIVTLVPMSFAVVEGLRVWQAERSLPLPRAALLAVPALLGLHTVLQWREPQSLKARTENWEWDGRELGLLLRDAFEASAPLLAVTSGGCVPYWSELPCLDMLGLNDHYIAHNPPRTFGTGTIGHEHGNGAYVLERSPDLIAFDLGSFKGTFRSGLELQRMPEFYEEYTPVRVQVPYLDDGAHLWFRKYSDRVGIRRTPTEIDVPAYLFNENPASSAYAADDGRLLSSVEKGRPLHVLLHDVDTSQAWSSTVRSPDADDILSLIQPVGPTTLRLVLRTTSREPIEVEGASLRAGSVKYGVSHFSSPSRSQPAHPAVEEGEEK